MKKSIRNIALLSALTLAVAPIMQGDVMGTNPRPGLAITSSWVNVAYAILALYGF